MLRVYDKKEEQSQSDASLNQTADEGKYRCGEPEGCMSSLGAH